MGISTIHVKSAQLLGKITVDMVGWTDEECGLHLSVFFWLWIELPIFFLLYQQQRNRKCVKTNRNRLIAAKHKIWLLACVFCNWFVCKNNKSQNQSITPFEYFLMFEILLSNCSILVGNTSFFVNIFVLWIMSGNCSAKLNFLLLLVLLVISIYNTDL